VSKLELESCSRNTVAVSSENAQSKINRFFHTPCIGVPRKHRFGNLLAVELESQPDVSPSCVQVTRGTLSSTLEATQVRLTVESTFLYCLVSRNCSISAVRGDGLGRGVGRELDGSWTGVGRTQIHMHKSRVEGFLGRRIKKGRR